MKTKAGKFAVAFGATVALMALAALTWTLLFARTGNLCRGIYVSGIDVGGKSKGEAARIVQDWATDRVHRDITLTALDRRWHGTLASLGLRVDWQDAIDRAYRVGRHGSIFNRAICVLTRDGRGKHILARSLVDQKRMGRTLAKVAQAVNRPHQDARVVVIEGHLQIKQETCGISLDKPNAAQVLADAVGTGRHIVPLPIISDTPKITAHDCAGITTLLSSFTTPFNPGKRGRTHNLTLAARTLNGRVLKPSEKLSVNQTVGPRLVGRGFQMAQVYIKGELVDGIGGGVCQVSSTLFNAVLLAGLKVVERSPHPEKVPYVAPGRDATVAYGQKDFKFVNTASDPIGIVTTVGGSHLTVQIYGSPADKRKVQVYRTLGPGGGVVLYQKIACADGKSIIDSFRTKYAPPHKPAPSARQVAPAKPSTPRTVLPPVLPAADNSQPVVE